jgi:hypothetical protein
MVQFSACCGAILNSWLGILAGLIGASLDHFETCGAEHDNADVFRSIMIFRRNCGLGCSRPSPRTRSRAHGEAPMTTYTIQIRLNREQFQTLVEQANTDGKSLEAVASSLIGGNLEKLAMQRDRYRRAMIDKLSREMFRPPPADPNLARQMDRNVLRRLASIPAPPKLT